MPIPYEILRWFVRRWSMEVTFAQVRRHLGVETQRQWTDLAIARTTPLLLGLFALITLWTHEIIATEPVSPRVPPGTARPAPNSEMPLAPCDTNCG